MDYPVSDSNARLVDGKFTDGDPVNSIPPSKNSAVYQNAVHDELLNVITGSGLTPDEAQLNQVFLAVQAIATSITANAISDLVGGAPTALDTLNELAAALADDANYAATITAALATKATTTALEDEATARASADTTLQTNITARMIGSNNLSELTSYVTARDNLGIYSCMADCVNESLIFAAPGRPGWNIFRISSGRYQISHNLGTELYSVQMTSTIGGGAAAGDSGENMVNWYDKQSNSIKFAVQNSGGSDNDGELVSVTLIRL